MADKEFKPYVPADKSLAELTLKAVFLGTLMAIGTTDPKATGFHLVILCLLLLPCFRGWLQLDSRSEPAAAPNERPGSAS